MPRIWSLEPPSLGVVILGKPFVTVQQAVPLREMGKSTHVNVVEQLKANGHRGNTQCQSWVIVIFPPPGTSTWM